MATMTATSSLTAQQLGFSKVKAYEQQLDDVMDLIDTTELKVKLKEVEEQYHQNPTEINKVRLGIIYHETALNLSFFSKTEFKGYAKKSFDTLSELFNAANTTQELLPFIASYRASALSLVGAETKKLRLIGNAFDLFQEAAEKYAAVSPLPEFLRGSVAENLPAVFFIKRKFAKKDFQAIIDKQEKNAPYANWEIMSFTYWAWAKQHQVKKYRTQSLAYLEKAIALDPNYKAGRKRAEKLKAKWRNTNCR
jgi:tetratricopeptide (TPR) repeat protein